MNIYKIERPDAYGYGDFDSAVVIARSEDDARTIHPNGAVNLPGQDCYYDWIAPYRVKITYVGIADPDLERGVVVASYNAA